MTSVGAVARLAWKAAWVAAAVLLVLYLGQQGALFFYQGF
jgi:hypothetical protein